jgi:hypothetical protein
MTTPDPLGVLESTAIVMASARLVSIDADKVAETAAQLAGLDAPAPEWSELHPVGKDDDETANLVLVLDALNFCFWQMPSAERRRWSVTWNGTTYDSWRPSPRMNSRTFSGRTMDAIPSCCSGHGVITCTRSARRCSTAGTVHSASLLIPPAVLLRH